MHQEGTFLFPKKEELLFPRSCVQLCTWFPKTKLNGLMVQYVLHEWSAFGICLVWADLFSCHCRHTCCHTQVAAQALLIAVGSPCDIAEVSCFLEQLSLCSSRSPAFTSALRSRPFSSDCQAQHVTILDHVTLKTITSASVWRCLQL